MAIYNEYYQKEDYFGKPYPELIDYFKTLNTGLNILDLGCGQGRDALALGRLGFKVTGVDISKVGIEQLNHVATEEKLKVKGLVKDLNDIDLINKYDVVLMDSMFHFYKNDVDEETKRLSAIANDLKHGGRLVIIVQASDFRKKTLKETIKNCRAQFSIEHETQFLYQEFNSEFYMIVFKKNKE